ncbi:MAG: hypothetical protein FWC89_04775 [Defluviitaleaceae bacterium]|nr:hypothetical protein [Defluviitaleaceae bacterium]
MEDKYDLKKMKRSVHPFQSAIDAGELILVDNLDMTDDEFESTLTSLTAEEREFAIRIRGKNRNRKST